MTTRTIHPADLEVLLESRVAAARERRLRERAAHVAKQGTSRRSGGRFRAAWLAVGVFGVLMAAAIAVAAVPVIDLTTENAEVSHQDAVFLQGGLGAGTGTFDPFLTLSTNDPTEAGYNGAADANYDQFFGGGRTHSLLISAVPIVTYEGQQYREFSLDANDQGSDSFMSVDEIKVFRDNQANLGAYDNGTETFGTDDSTTATKIFDLDQPIILDSQGLESGSGVSDITVLLPVNLFPTDCFYGSLTCDQYLIFYTESGFLGTSQGDGKNYDVTAGFEEWRVALQPVVNVSKTVTASVDRTYPWNVEKTADVESIDLFAGDTASIGWTVTATAGEPTDSNLSVSGSITITNPTGGEVIPEKIPATINSVTDVLTQGAIDTGLTVACPEPFPFTLDAGDTLVCTYSGTPPNADAGMNTATANIDISDTETADYSGSAAVAFGVEAVDDCVAVTDDNATPGDTGDDTILDSELCVGDSPGTYTFSTDVGPFAIADCDATTVTNTARTETNDTATGDSASDSVAVTCHGLSVSKNATTTFTRNWDWSVAKSRVIVDGENDGDGDPATLTLAPGQTYAATYHVTASVSGTNDSDWAVSGTITITNDAPIDADDVAVSDVLSDATVATVDCDPLTVGDQATVDVPANSSAQCTYATDLSDGSARTNTATATLFDVDYDSQAVDVSFDHDPTTLEDECVVVSDDNGTPGDTTDDTVLDASLCASEAPHTYEYTLEIGPYEACGSFDFTNVATIVTVDDENDSGETHSSTYTVGVEVPCPEGCTLTQGYWRTHNDSFRGGAPTDDTWQLLGDIDADGIVEGEGETFFLSDQTYFEVMWTAPKGNAYYILAVQYIAANLNVLAGADSSAVGDELAAATTLFETYEPADIAALKGNTGKALRAQFIDLAGTLGAYNEGAIGPGHCDEDGISDTSTPVTGLVLPPLLPVRRRREV